VTVIWTISLHFFGLLSVGRLLVGTFPVPFGLLVEVLSREYIVKLTEQIDELENPTI